MDFIEYFNLFCRFVEEIVLVQNQPNYKYMFFFIHSFIIYCECFNLILFGWLFFHDDNFIWPKVECVMQFFMERKIQLLYESFEI